MTLHWDALLIVLGVSAGATIAVVSLVTLAVLSLSGRGPSGRGLSGRGPAGLGPAGRAEPSHLPGRAPFAPAAGAVVAGISLAVTAGIVLLALWVLIAR